MSFGDGDLHEKCEMYRRQLGGVNAASNRKSQRIRELEKRMKRLEKLVRIYGEMANYFCERFACCDAEFANYKYCIGLPQGGQCELGWCNDESRELEIEVDA